MMFNGLRHLRVRLKIRVEFVQPDLQFEQDKPDISIDYEPARII